MSILKKIFRAIGALFGFARKDDTQNPINDIKLMGHHGVLMAPAVLIHEDNRFVLSIEYDFHGIPSWIEAHESEQSLHIVQTTGDIATLKLPLDQNRHDLKNALHQATHIALISGIGKSRILHHLSFTYHKSA